MKKIFLLTVGLVLLYGCNQENRARQLYQEALQLQQEHKYSEAIAKYNGIINKYPKTQIAKSVENAIQETKKAQLSYYITENKPRIIAAVRNYPIPTSFDEKTMLYVKIIAQEADISLDNEPRVDRELKATDIAMCSFMGYLATSCVLEVGKNKYIWDASSTDNEEWTVTMKSNSNRVLEPTPKSHTSILKINLKNQTLALTSRGLCGIFDPELEKTLSKRKSKIDWEKECVLPLKVEGVLRENEGI